MKQTSKRIHILEVGGRGGVYQHALAVAVALAQLQYTVVVHTATDPEITDPRIETCNCFSWFRGSRFRKILIPLTFVVRTIPHMMRQGGTVWVQGTFKPLLTLIALSALRVGRTTLFSPHNLFSRRGSFERFMIHACIRASKRLILYNRPDLEAFRARINVFLAPLLMYTPVISPEVGEYWRRELKSLGIGVASLGQIRSDKNIPLLIEASTISGVPLLVMGPDAGALAQITALRETLGASQVVIRPGYFPLEDLAAVAALCGAVALPYSIASQSGVAVMARAYGTPVIAYEVGGLIEQADDLISTLAPQAWAAAFAANRALLVEREIPEPSGPTKSELGLIEQAVRIAT